MSVVWRVLAVALLAYAAYAVIFFFFQRHLMYPGASMLPARGVSDRDLPFVEEVQLVTSVGRVEALFMTAGGSADAAPYPAIIFTHGNGELVDSWPAPLSSFRDLGIGVLIVEYPGYGRSAGTPSQRTIMETMIAAHDWLIARTDIDETRIVAMGRSLGSGPAVGLAGARPVAALILQSPFKSVAAMATERFYLPPFLARDRFDNQAILQSYDGPVLVLHGTRDRVVPYTHGAALASLAARGQLIPQGCAHNDCPPSWPGFVNQVQSFLLKSGILTRPGT
ncbi:MAG: alpha/beta hydrolase [Gemmatimonadetes bacterium]|nr:alpha/beta hydrolase [Gemmatimonadota bacterium]